MTEEEETILQPSECSLEKERVKDELRVEAATGGLDDGKRDSPRSTPRSPLTPRTPKSPLTHIAHSHKRDSGYLTDSPASLTAGHFTYELTSPQEELHELGEVFSSEASTSDREDALGHVARSETPVSMSESSSRNASPQMRVCTWRTPVTEPIPIPVRRSGLDMPIPPYYQYGASPPRAPLRPSPFSTGSLAVHAGQWSSSHMGSPSRTTSTQTPAQHSQIIEEAIQWQIGGLSDGADGLPDMEMADDDDDDDEEVFVPANAPFQRSLSHRIEARGTAVERLRCYSDSDEVRISHEPLPDLIQFRRDRTRSESAVQPLLRQEVGQFARELRRISDEFHLSYSPTESSRLLDSIDERLNSDELTDNHSASFPGARGTWLDNLCEFIRPNMRRRPRTHSGGRPRAHSDVTSASRMSLSRRDDFYE
ncbi:uncharacterized protein LOC135485624 [Lineus longissimus]|uniref:uncharacterized protein LOC135485624 n=1 Tax=Lineus longissimus TaxID=88925 RepID=UPI00315D5E82